MPAARLIGFVVAVAIVVVIGVRAAQSVHSDRLTWWPLPLALALATAWWLLLARGWAVLATGHSSAEDVGTWCRTQTLRYLPGGVWAPASRATILRGGLLDRLSTVAAENVIALCAALAVGGVALAASGAALWLPLVLALGAPALASRFVADRTRLEPARTRRATVNYLVAFIGYALAALLVQGAVSGFQHPFAVAGAAGIAWAAGLVAVFAPGGVGVRELVYVALLAQTLPSGELAAGAVTLRILTVIAELGVLLVAGRPRLDAAELRRAIAPAVTFVRRHALFLGLLGAGVVLRVLTSIAYWPALLSYDSQGFLQNAAHLRPDPVRPIGYPVFLWILNNAHDLAVVPAVQHALGILIAGLIYAVLLRLGIRRWAAALATAPVLLDAYQLDIEHYVLAETLFEALLVAGCVAVLWRRRPGIVQAAIAGLLFAGVALTRANGFVVIAPALITVLCLRWTAAPRARDPGGAWAKLVRAAGRGIRGLRPGLPAAIALLVAFALPLAAYGFWFHRLHGRYAITDYGGRFLYARVTPFVDCSKFKVPANERALCPSAPVGQRPTMAGSTVEYYMWHYNSPVWNVPVHLAGDFARRAIRYQPLDYLRTVSHDFLRGFAPIRTAEHGELPISRWQFPPSYPHYLPNTDDLIRTHGGGGSGADRTLARDLREYQRLVFAPGPVLAIGLIGGLLAALGLGRARRSGLRSASFLFAATGLVTFGSTVIANQFSWRYVLPLLVLLPPAAAVGLTALLRRPEPRAATAASGAAVVGEGAQVADPARGEPGPAPGRA
ncbi:MAG TPA: phospholipid carrier-dependent glycosyltransferase [Solirubrobacteraceae bacterium]|nr:phospholipid carrier-dependent glycosyltransferase [Solirubrobacteraceae bacterium]